MRLLLTVSCLSAMAASAAAQCGLVADLEPGSANINHIAYLTSAFADVLYFQGRTSAHGSELWRWTPAGGAQRVVDLVPGQGSSQPYDLVPCCTAAGPRLFYSAFDIGHGHELYVTDGSAAGTMRIAEIRPGSNGSVIEHMVAAGQRVFFSANDGTHGDELYVSDGTAAGSHMVVDIIPGVGNGRPQAIFAFGDRVLFSAITAAHGKELWISDGTAAGTQMIADLYPGTTGSEPRAFVRLGDLAYFIATSPTIGSEVWRTDGTAAGTVPIGDVFGGSSWGPGELVVAGDRLFFTELKGSGVGMVYVSDGTLAGSMALGVEARDLRPAGGRIFFVGNGQLAGAEPWVSDGTVAGTRLCLDIQPGGFGSNPSEFVACGDGVLFVCKGTVNGELWSSDGTAAGTTHVCTLDPGGNASPKGLVTCRGRVFMNAYSPSVGRELHGIAMPGATQTQLGGSTGPDHPRLATVDDAQPVLGSTVDLVAHGPSGSLAVLFADRAAPPIPVLASPGLIGSGADHVGLQTGSAIFLASAVASSFVVPFALPSDPSFEGVMLDFQALWFDGAANPMLQASDGMRLTLGAARPH